MSDTWCFPQSLSSSELLELFALSFQHLCLLTFLVLRASVRLCECLFGIAWDHLFDQPKEAFDWLESPIPTMHWGKPYALRGRQCVWDNDAHAPLQSGWWMWRHVQKESCFCAAATSLTSNSSPAELSWKKVTPQSGSEWFYWWNPHDTCGAKFCDQQTTTETDTDGSLPLRGDLFQSVPSIFGMISDFICVELLVCETSAAFIQAPQNCAWMLHYY